MTRPLDSRAQSLRILQNQKQILDRKYDDRSWKQRMVKRKLAAKHKIRTENKQIVCMTSSQVYPVPVRPMLKLWKNSSTHEPTLHHDIPLSLVLQSGGKYDDYQNVTSIAKLHPRSYASLIFCSYSPAPSRSRFPSSSPHPDVMSIL